ncbi:ATP-binding protein [Streptomyces sp. NPDC050095]|uniref:ATP-binding protein n=1 Tax=unclassified Streptomyces TaxID=2593676 RepID=UPI00341540B7
MPADVPMPFTESPDRRSWRIEADVRAPGTARTLTRRALAEWGLDSFTERATLIVSELATNAVVHGARPSEHGKDRDEYIALSLVREPTSLRIEVEDQSPVFPVPRARPTPDEATSGWGLHIVAAQADEWGVHARPAGRGKGVQASLWIEDGRART